jgi:hypothetical protein
MPKSRVRAKKPDKLSGVPARVMNLSPSDWPADKRGLWCRFYLDGAAGRPLRETRDSRGFSNSWQRAAYRMGQRDSEVAPDEVAQHSKRQKAEQERRALFARMREDALDRRLDALDGLSFGAPSLGPDFNNRVPGIADALASALGIGTLISNHDRRGR